MTSLWTHAWKPDGKGVTDGGDPGGDIQASDSYETRFLHVAWPKAMVILYAYAAEDEEKCPGEFWVQVQAEFMLCHDRAQPGDTEIWSDARYYDLPGEYETAALAQADARRYMAIFAGGYLPPEIAAWDGVLHRGRGRLPEASYPYELTPPGADGEPAGQADVWAEVDAELRQRGAIR
jgi:hypothetical protein